MNLHKQPIGGFLVSIGALTKLQVNIILAAQERGDTRLFGEIGIDLQFFDDYAIKRYIDYVELMRKASLPPRD